MADYLKVDCNKEVVGLVFGCWCTTKRAGVCIRRAINLSRLRAFFLQSLERTDIYFLFKDFRGCRDFCWTLVLTGDDFIRRCFVKCVCSRFDKVIQSAIDVNSDLR